MAGQSIIVSDIRATGRFGKMIDLLIDGQAVSVQLPGDKNTAAEIISFCKSYASVYRSDKQADIAAKASIASLIGQDIEKM
jgi:hypothetical protein